MFRRVLVPVRGDGHGASVLTLGSSIVRPHGGHLRVVHVHARPQDLLPFGVPVSKKMRELILSNAQGMADSEEHRLHDLFKDYCKTHNVTEVETSPSTSEAGRVTATWEEIEGKQAAIVGKLGRLADLVVVAKPDRNTGLGHNTFQTALFDVGALTAVAPDREVSSVLGHVAIAWNGSVEAGRAVKRALRMLVNADKVTILRGDEKDLGPLGPAALADYLACHGINAEMKTFEATEKSAPQKILDAVSECGAEALLMGAFGRGSGQDFRLGNVSDAVLHDAEIPLLMAH